MSYPPTSTNVAATSRPRRGTSSLPRLLVELLEGTGVDVDGASPYDIQVHDAETYRRILTHGSLGFGEAYMDGLWDCQRLDAMLTALLRAGIGERIRTLPRLRLLLSVIASVARNWLINRQSTHRAFRIGEQHYDIDNDLFEAMLDPTLSYSCGYWAHAEDLDQAQRDKLDMVCRKLELKPGERLLDIGCGWGGLARHAAQHFDVDVFGITVSHEQLKTARQRCAGLPVQLELMDYRDLDGRYDKIASVGMFEHVGPKNYAALFNTLRRVLNDVGARANAGWIARGRGRLPHYLAQARRSGCLMRHLGPAAQGQFRTNGLGALVTPPPHAPGPICPAAAAIAASA